MKIQYRMCFVCVMSIRNFNNVLTLALFDLHFWYLYHFCSVMRYQNCILSAQTVASFVNTLKLMAAAESKSNGCTTVGSDQKEYVITQVYTGTSLRSIIYRK
jgi:exosortase/archaeosortase